MTAENGTGKGGTGKRRGRKRLQEAEWKKRFVTVEKILNTANDRGISVPQACAREGKPYSTFRGWLEEYNKRKTNND